jgi:hypothetical protein
LLLQFRAVTHQPLFGIPYFCIRKLAHFSVGSHLLRGVNVLLALLVSVIQVDHGRNLRTFARQLAVLVEIGRDAFAAQQAIQLLQAHAKLRELGSYTFVHSDG